MLEFASLKSPAYNRYHLILAPDCSSFDSQMWKKLIRGPKITVFTSIVTLKFWPSLRLINVLPYLPVCKSIPCISRPPIFGAEKYVFLISGWEFSWKLILFLRTFFQAHYSYTKKITASLDVKFIIARTRVLKRVLATQV